LLDELSHLVGAAGAADDATRSEQLGEASGGGPDGAGGGGDEDDVALVQLADPLQADPSREAGLAEHTEPCTDWSGFGVDDGDGRGVDHGVLAPAGAVTDDDAGGNPLVLAGDHLADR
jgi:hypothetical protein